MTVDIDSMTIGDAKRVASLVGRISTSCDQRHPFIGQYAIARGSSAGVHAGEIVSVDGANVILRNSRRLWSWKGKAGVALSGVAQHGLASGCKVDSVNPLICIIGVCELIPCTQVAKESIDAA